MSADGDGDGDGGVPTTLPSGQTPRPSRPDTKYPVRGNPSLRQIQMFPFGDLGPKLFVFSCSCQVRKSEVRVLGSPTHVQVSSLRTDPGSGSTRTSIRDGHDHPGRSAPVWCCGSLVCRAVTATSWTVCPNLLSLTPPTPTAASHRSQREKI